MHKLYIASNHLGHIYWQMRAELPMASSYFATEGQFDTFVKKGQELEAVFCDMGGPNDPINPVVAEAVRAVEAIADEAARNYAVGFGEWWRRWNAYADSILDAREETP
jgi:hypothetical protein